MFKRIRTFFGVEKVNRIWIFKAVCSQSIKSFIPQYNYGNQFITTAC